MAVQRVVTTSSTGYRVGVVGPDASELFFFPFRRVNIHIKKEQGREAKGTTVNFVTA